jgi:hypothetical protein
VSDGAAGVERFDIYRTFGREILNHSMSAFRELLFHASWLFLGVVALGGLGALVVGNRRLDRTMQRWGIAVFLIAALVGGLRWMLPTDREQMERRSRDLVKAVESADWNALNQLIDANTSVAFGSQSFAAGKQAVIGLAKSARDANGLKSVYILGVDSAQTQTLITVSMEVYSTQDRTQGQPVTSSWQLDYEQSGDNWILDKITLIRVGEDNVSQNFNPFAH